MAEMITKIPVKTQEKPTQTPAEPAGEGAWQVLTHLRQEVDRLFDDVSRRVTIFPLSRRVFDWEPFARLGLSSRGLVPVVDVIEGDNAFEIATELPGLDQKDVEVTVSEGVLTIKGEKKEEKEQKGESYYLSERRFGAFLRTFELPRGVDADRIEANFEKGVLRIVLPKKTEAMKQERKIEVGPR